MYCVPLSVLRPTQITIGMDYVHAKSLITARYTGTQLKRFMRDHALRVVVGPRNALYIVDHHHWARAWMELGYTEAPVTVVADWHHLGRRRFWRKMESKRWVHPFDETGKRCSVNNLPSTIDGLVDDPYHSLAAFARRAGAYRKPTRAFVTFVWSEFIRKHVAAPDKGAASFSLALLRTIKICRSKTAESLPGYLGDKLP
ncbi:ParB/Srx family N-terminal domain-containing protein [Burkholderia cenocepacia]|uniref:ParB/Srx family N-terminal domain-containing protein n=1 Tax=Burkholderia cenocepacia TaxID=95486 RepID=UPI00285D0679|nr:ParB/Srx family N-terminal domain-containing protein [Burkholderia cenocepacia]MDR8048030.1 ParB/Srx family N-terminal domain-containing protein [Burkholderia cenocepacia]